MITGITGNVGRELAGLLAEAGRAVVGVTRGPATALAPGVRVVEADPRSPRTLAPAFKGVDTLVINLAATGDVPRELLATAREHGVTHAVLISAVTVEYGGGYARFAERFKASEDAVAASGLEWTFLRCADFDTNAAVWAPQIRATGIVRAAYAEAATSCIHPRDIAAVAAVVIADRKHRGRAYALTGPEPLTQRDKVRQIGEVIGRDVQLHEISADAARDAMLAQGVPREIPDRMLGYLAECVARPGPTTETVAELLGRAPLPFKTWAVEHASMFR